MTKIFGLAGIVLTTLVVGTGCASEASGDDVGSEDGANNEMNADDSINVDRIFEKAGQDLLRKDPRAIVYVPRRIPKSVIGSNASNLFAFADVSKFEGKTTWTITLGVGKDCNGSNACTLAYFETQAKGKLSGPTNMKIAEFDVRFEQGTCGASCNSPTVSWENNADERLLHTVSVNAAKAENVSVFRSAIRNPLFSPDA